MNEEMLKYLSDLFNNAWIYSAPVLEFLILSFIIYYALYFLRGTRSANILAGIIIAIILLTIVTEYLKFGVLNWLVNGLWSIFGIGLIIVFQPELRRAFAQIGTHPFARRQKMEETINEVVIAAKNMSEQRTGALIVFQRRIGMRALISNGIMIDARVSHSLLQTIFHPNTPLHDGGIAIDDNNKIAAAHVIFPLSQNVSLTSDFGTRHRAAIGITEETDAVAVVVSEETGKISIACRGNIKIGLNTEKLARFLHSLLVKPQEELEFSLFDSDEENDELMNEARNEVAR